MIEKLNDATKMAYRCLSAGKKAEFAEALASSYRLILTSVQAYMAEKYKFTEALWIQIPRRDTK